jgi:hypothetical protein
VQEAWNDIQESLDLDLLTLSIGIGVERMIGMLTLFASAGPAVNFASVDATYRESLLVSRNGGAAETLQTWDDSTCETDVSVGAFAQGGASLALTERFSAAVMVRYDWTDDVSESVGPATIDADLDGYAVYGMLQFSI